MKTCLFFIQLTASFLKILIFQNKIPNFNNSWLKFDIKTAKTGWIVTGFLNIKISLSNLFYIYISDEMYNDRFLVRERFPLLFFLISSH